MQDLSLHVAQTDSSLTRHPHAANLENMPSKNPIGHMYRQNVFFSKNIPDMMASPIINNR
jgi:hypothetical protein